MLFLNNYVVQRVLKMGDALRVLEDGHRELAKRELVARPRVDIYTETDRPETFHRWGTMEARARGCNAMPSA